MWSESGTHFDEKKMTQSRSILSCTTILSGLLVLNTYNCQSVAFAASTNDTFIIAQASPALTPEEIRRRLEEEERRKRQNQATPPAQQKPTIAPPVPGHVVPATPPATVQHPVAPPAVAPVKPVTPPPPPIPNGQHPVPGQPAPIHPGQAPVVAPIAPPSTTVQPPKPLPPGFVPQQQGHVPTVTPGQPPATVPKFQPPAGNPPPSPQAPVQPQQGRVQSAAPGQPSTFAPHFQQPAGNQPRGNGITPLQAGAIGAAAGLVGGMIIGQQVHGIGEVQSSRQTVQQNGATFYSEPGRLIVREGDGLYVRHDEMERFRDLGGEVDVEQRGDETIQIANRPDGSKIITVLDRDGQLLKRIRRLPNGVEIVLIDNTYGRRPQRFADEVIVVAPPPVLTELDAGDADETRIYETLSAPPVASLPHRYTLDEIRYSRDLRHYMPSVDLNAITFDTGSWTVPDEEIRQLKGIADAINRAIRANPNEIFLIEGHTDAVGSDVDNLSLSDRRAGSVASVLTQAYNVPPENLTTQGYGSQFLKVQTSGPSRENRRVVVRRITPLLANSTQH